MATVTLGQVTSPTNATYDPRTLTTTTPTPTAPTVPGMTSDQQSAYDALRDLFASYGLPINSDILDVIKSAAVNGDSADLVQIQLQGTDSWKQRFAGNEQRRAAGLNVLSVAEYLAQENQYATVMRNAGVPVGFYDDPSDYAKFIGMSVSPAEIQDRVNSAIDVVNREDPSVINELAKRGLTVGQVIAHALDPERAAPLIKRDLNSVLIGAAAARAGVNTGVAYADRLAARGIQEQQAAQGFGQVSDLTKTAGKLGNIYGVDYTEGDALSEVFDSNADAASERKRVSSQERSNFAGSSTYGVNKTSTAGQY